MLLQSGSSVPEWILKLPKPSKMKRREMGKVKRAEFVNNARRIGRGDAIKKRCVCNTSWSQTRERELARSTADTGAQGHDRCIEAAEGKAGTKQAGEALGRCHSRSCRSCRILSARVRKDKLKAGNERAV